MGPDNPYYQKSHRILGTGIILTGVVILSIGLILGIEFPNYVLKQRQLRSCITSPSSRDYEPWLHNRNRTKRNFLYIRNMTNGQSFGQTPEFQLVGPYIYDETEVKVDVRFWLGSVSYHPWRRQSFNAKMTAKYCSQCSANDRVTTINPAFLQVVNVFPNEEYYFISLVPSLLSDHLKRLQGEGTPESSSGGGGLWSLGEVDFDVWLRRGDTSYKKDIVKDRSRTTESTATYLHLYETLSNATIPHQRRQWDMCDTHMFKSSSQVVNETNEDPPSHCGLLYYLVRLRDTSFVNWIRMRPTLSSIMCHNHKNESCFLNHPINNVSTSYVRAIAVYVTEYLPSVLRSRVSLEGTQVAELSVHQIATGYRVERMTLKATVKLSVQNVVHVSGFLDHQETALEAKKLAKRITLKTCLFNRPQMDNLDYDEVDEFLGCDWDTFETSWEVRGVQDYKIPTTSSLAPCREPRVFATSLMFYIPELWRPARYVRVGSVEFDNVNLQDFWLDPQDRMSRISTSGITGYLSWVQMTSRITRHEDGVKIDASSIVNSNRYFVEPVSGEVWRRLANFRFEVALKRDFDSTTPNTSSEWMDQPFEYYALHIETEPSAHTLWIYQTEVHVLLQASCGGLIGFTIVGVLVMALGVSVALAVIRRPSNRVAPLFYVNPNLPPMETTNDNRINVFIIEEHNK